MVRESSKVEFQSYPPRIPAGQADVSLLKTTLKDSAVGDSLIIQSTKIGFKRKYNFKT
jgi:hypothetical protein